jgi:hypothetical protein
VESAEMLAKAKPELKKNIDSDEEETGSKPVSKNK